MNRIATLQEAHPFLTEREARYLCVIAYQVAHSPDHFNIGDLTTDEWMDLAIRKLVMTNSEDLKNLIAYCNEFYTD